MNTVLRFLFSAVGLLVASSVVSGIHHGPFVDLLIVAVLLGALNATVGQFLRLLAIVPMACSFGCFNLVINGLIFWWAGSLSRMLGLQFSVDGFWPAFWGALVSSMVAGLLGWLFLPKASRPGRPGPRPGPGSGGDDEGPRPIKIVNP
ncbi:MAG TPA: phage holin family protein [Holophagaceae bacterium]|nr:phage holin family protein [Holophagaceae bacterium]